jgi:hypothetical protein
MAKNLRRVIRWPALCAFALGMPLAGAVPVTVSDPYHEFVVNSFNTLGIVPGPRQIFGAATVLPNGGNGTTATATQGATTLALPWFGTSVFSNEFSAGINLNPALLGSWSMTFRNGTDATTVNSPVIKSTIPMPFAQSVNISGSTVNWTLPADPSIDAVRINLRDHGLNVAGTGTDIVFNATFSRGTTTATLPAILANGLPLIGSHFYTIELSLIDTANNSSVFSQSQIERRSRLYVDFRPVNWGAPVYLPVVEQRPNGQTPIFHFDIAAVNSSSVFYIDPPVVNGYDYAIGSGDPNIAAVTLPSGIGDNQYQVVLADGRSFEVAGGTTFQFDAGGVASFSVRGIESSANINPDDGTAFITGLKFTGAGHFTGTMTAVVPEPTTAALLAAGLLVIGAACFRRR